MQVTLELTTDELMTIGRLVSEEIATVHALTQEKPEEVEWVSHQVRQLEELRWKFQ